MADALTGELACRVHLAATVEGLIRQDGGGILRIMEIQRYTVVVVHYCTCRLAAEFYVENVGKDTDEPFPIFRKPT